MKRSQRKLSESRDDNTISAGALMGYRETVAELGGDPAALLSRCGFAPDVLSKPEKRISQAAMGKLLDLSATRLDAPDFALRLARRQCLGMLGPIGLMMERSGTVGEALAVAQNYIALHAAGEHWTVARYPASVVITRYSYCATSAGGARQLELSIAACFRLITLLAGTDFVPLEVSFSHAAISPIGVYTRYFGCTPRFDAEQDQLVLPAALLARKVAAVDASSLDFVRRELDSALDALRGDLPRQVRLLILQMLGSVTPTAAAVAALLGLHERTLQRRLAAEGSSFREILLDARMETAARLLASGNMPVTLLAGALGYADTPAFTHAFRKCAGMSPRAYRQNRRTMRDPRQA